MSTDKHKGASGKLPTELEGKIALAWQQARHGDPGQAFMLSRQLVEEGTARNAVPLFDAGLLIALRDHLNGKHMVAADGLYRMMGGDHRARMAQEILLAMMREAMRSRLPQTPQTRPTQGRLVLGAGSGRSGSTTLCTLLAAQPQTCWSHEHPPLIPWDSDGWDEAGFHLTRMGLLARAYAVVADVAHWWLPKLPPILRAHPHARCVIIRRDRAATVDSFMRVKALRAPGGINHWMTHDGKRFRSNHWDVCYPKFPVNDPEEAIGLYWDHYYALADKAVRSDPDRVRMFEIDALSDPAGQRDILHFCGYEAPVLVPDAHQNRGSAQDGKRHWHNPFGPKGLLRTAPPQRR